MHIGIAQYNVAKTHSALVGPLKASNEPECGCFAATAGAKERKNFPGLHREVQIVDHRRLSRGEALGQSLD